jgi:hypothetical protein
MAIKVKHQVKQSNNQYTTVYAETSADLVKHGQSNVETTLNDMTKTINDHTSKSASTSQEGHIQLSDSTSSTSTSLEATANAVKKAYDLATTANANATKANDAIGTHTHMYAGSSSAGGSATSALTCTGNSKTASQLQTARAISLTGNITGSASFDGSANVSIATSVVSPTSGSWHQGLVSITSAGVSEMGKCIDFHYASDGTSDYSCRLQCASDAGNTISLPTSSGTLALTSHTHNSYTYLHLGYGASSGSNSYSTAIGYGATTTATYATALGYAPTASGKYATALGALAESSNTGTLAIGYKTTASGTYSIAIGYMTGATKTWGCAMGYSCNADAQESVSMGVGNRASGLESSAMGRFCLASGNYSSAFGYGAEATGYMQASTGQWGTNYTNTSLSTTDPIFTIGNGTESASSNAFRVTQAGRVYAKGAYSSSGADYAEMFEWEDGNIEDEDRVGYFVSLEGNYIRKANSNDDYILGIVSANPSVIGDNPEAWSNKYLTDEWGRALTEWIEVEHSEISKAIDSDSEERTNEELSQISDNEIENLSDKILDTSLEEHFIINPKYDASRQGSYIERSRRPEWAPVGMMGKLLVRDDGTCKVGKFCKPNDEGIATLTEGKDGYYVMDRINENIIKVLFR